MRLLGRRLLVKPIEEISSSGLILQSRLDESISARVEYVGDGIHGEVGEGDIVYFRKWMIKPFEGGLYFLDYKYVYRSVSGIYERLHNNRVLVELTDFNDTIKCGGYDLYFDTDFNNGLHTPRVGMVVGLPDKLYYDEEDAKNDGVSLKFDVDIEVKLGDEVWLRWKDVHNALGHLWNRG